MDLPVYLVSCVLMFLSTINVRVLALAAPWVSKVWRQACARLSVTIQLDKADAVIANRLRVNRFFPNAISISLIPNVTDDEFRSYVENMDMYTRIQRENFFHSWLPSDQMVRYLVTWITCHGTETDHIETMSKWMFVEAYANRLNGWKPKHAHAILVALLAYGEEDDTTAIRTFVDTRRANIEERLARWAVPCGP